jgi:protein-S-isoprenylcysteine O-methyltransferase Ste14
MQTLRTIGWIACVVYSTVPAFWLLIHSRAEYWRSQKRSPYRIVVPIWTVMWVVVAGMTFKWRDILVYENTWAWIPGAALFGIGLILYKRSRHQFTMAQLGGLPEVLGGGEQRLATTGIRARVRHPVYLGHLCEMLAWSVGTGLAVCWILTAFGVVTGAVMIRMEDRELEARFGEQYRQYRSRVPAILPKIN